MQLRCYHNRANLRVFHPAKEANPVTQKLHRCCLPELTYTGLSASSGLQIESMPNVQRLRLETSPKLDAIQMLRDVLASQTESRKLSMLRISNMTLKADGSELLAILEYGVAGMDEDGNRQDKPVVNGTYELTVIRETDEIESLESGIDGLVILTVIDATSTLSTGSIMSLMAENRTMIT